MKLAEFQSAFAAALFSRDDGQAAAPGPLAALQAQPAFAVYRNTVMKGCIDALEANFPAVTRLVGSEWFRAAAALYVVAEVPRDARLQLYGDRFASFLDRFEPARYLRYLPYLADVARLDRCWTEAHTAADAPAVDGAWLAQLAPAALGNLRMTPHSATRWHWFAEQPIRSIWQRNRAPQTDATDTAQTDETAGNPLVWQGEGALLTRPADTVVWCEAGPADCAFLDACARGDPLAHAAQAALHCQPDADLASLLARLLQAGALSLSAEVAPQALSSRCPS